MSIYLDTTGAGLHKRGYRRNSNLAPIRETLAAGILDLARLRSDTIVCDPFCGSGTFLIEAARRACRIAPGLDRRFISEQWDCVPKTAWQEARMEALDRIDRSVGFEGYGFDIDPAAVQLTMDNAKKAGVDKFLHIELGKGIAMVGMCVALSSVFVSEIKLVVLSVLGTYLSGIVLDHFIFGFNIKRRVCIISKKEAEIRRFILHDLHSGATIYEATGAYDNKPHSEIIAIVDKNEYTKLISFLEKCDPAAFVTVYNVNEVFYRPKV